MPLASKCTTSMKKGMFFRNDGMLKPEYGARRPLPTVRKARTLSVAMADRSGEGTAAKRSASEGGIRRIAGDPDARAPGSPRREPFAPTWAKTKSGLTALREGANKPARPPSPAGSPTRAASPGKVQVEPPAWAKAKTKDLMAASAKENPRSDPARPQRPQLRADFEPLWAKASEGGAGGAGAGGTSPARPQLQTQRSAPSLRTDNDQSKSGSSRPTARSDPFEPAWAKTTPNSNDQSKSGPSRPTVRSDGGAASPKLDSSKSGVSRLDSGVAAKEEPPLARSRTVDLANADAQADRPWTRQLSRSATFKANLEDNDPAPGALPGWAERMLSGGDATDAGQKTAPQLVRQVSTLRRSQSAAGPRQAGGEEPAAASRSQSAARAGASTDLDAGDRQAAIFRDDRSKGGEQPSEAAQKLSTARAFTKASGQMDADVAKQSPDAGNVGDAGRRSPRSGRKSPSKGNDSPRKDPSPRAQSSPAAAPKPSAAQSTPAAAPLAATSRQPWSPGADGMRTIASGGSGSPAPKSTVPNLKPQNSERMEPEKWRIWRQMVDRKALGGHFAPVPMDIASDYWEMPTFAKDHDAALADSRLLHKRRPSDVLHPAADKDLGPANAAFTDRAVRLREGRGLKTVLMSENSHPETEWKSHGDCNCPVCKPQGWHAAGQVSHNLHHNKVVPCGKDHPIQRTAWGSSPLSPTFKSEGLAKALAYDHTAPNQEEEHTFVKSLGKKMLMSPDSTLKRGAMQRSWSESALTVPAGSFNQDLRPECLTHRSKRRQVWQDGLETGRLRSGVAFVIDPVESDPPAPTAVLASRKARGTCHGKFSEDSQRLTVERNQEVFRFAEPSFPRGRSPSPQLQPGEAAGLHRDEQRRIKERVHGVPTSSPMIRSNVSNSSGNMAALLNHDTLQQSFVREKEYRLRTDPIFAEKCYTTVENAFVQKQIATTLKSTFGHHSARAPGEVFWTLGHQE